MKKRIILLIPALLIISLIIISCSGSPEKNIIGLWKATSVETKVDSTIISNEQI